MSAREHGMSRKSESPVLMGIMIVAIILAAGIMIGIVSVDVPMAAETAPAPSEASAQALKEIAAKLGEIKTSIDNLTRAVGKRK